MVKYIMEGLDAKKLIASLKEGLRSENPIAFNNALILLRNMLSKLLDEPVLASLPTPEKAADKGKKLQITLTTPEGEKIILKPTGESTLLITNQEQLPKNNPVSPPATNNFLSAPSAMHNSAAMNRSSSINPQLIEVVKAARDARTALNTAGTALNTAPTKPTKPAVINVRRGLSGLSGLSAFGRYVKKPLMPRIH